MLQRLHARFWQRLTTLWDCVFAFREGSAAGFRQVLGRRRSPRRRQPQSVTLTVDRLEPRWLMSTVSLATGPTVVEGTTATISVLLDVTSSSSITVDYSTVAGSATAGSDYTSSSGTVVFPAGASVENISAATIDDTLHEADETFSFVLSNPTNASLGTSTATVTIEDNDPLPTVAIDSSVSHDEGNSGTTAFVFGVTLSPASGLAVSVSWATADGTATTADSDYTGDSGTLTFNPGDTSTAVTVLVNGDTTPEADETFYVNLGTPSNADLGNGTGTGTITNDDAPPPPPPTVAIDSSVSHDEGNSGTTAFVFGVTLSAASGLTVSVPWATADGTASAGSDYTGDSGTLTFNPGDTSEAVTVLVNGDTTPEADETFYVNLGTPSNADLGNGTGTGTIKNDDAALSIGNVSQNEGNSGTTNFLFPVTIPYASSQTVTVAYATADGTATTSSDYGSASGTLTFSPGDTSKTVTVGVVGDTVGELDETFTVNLSDASNATIASGTGTGTIVNDDPGALAINSVTHDEGDSGTTNFVFSVTLAGPVSYTVTVNYATADGTATAGSDYTSASGTLTFSSGQTCQQVTVAVAGDTTAEPDETFAVNLSGPSHATPSTLSGTGTIKNDDAGFSINDVSHNEGNSGSTSYVFTVSTPYASSQTATVNYATADGTATTADSDYTSACGGLTFAPGTTSQNLTVLVTGDTYNEDDETFVVNLSSATHGTVVRSPGTGTVVNDDAVPTVSFSSIRYSVSENGATALITAVLSAASGKAVSVNYTTADLCGCGSSAQDVNNELQDLEDGIGSTIAPTLDPPALAGDKYSAQSGTLSFAVHSATATFAIPIIDNTVADGNEDFLVKLQDPTTNAIESKPTRGIVTIVDNETTQLYDGSGNLTEQSFPGGATKSYGFSGGKLQTVKNELNQTTTYSYNGSGDLATATDPLNQTTTYTYNAAHQLSTATDPGGAVTTYSYDAEGRLTKVTYPGQLDPAYTYDANGNVLTETDDRGFTTTYTYNSANQLATQTDPLGETTTFGYDSAGHQITVTDPLHRVTTTLYDAGGRVTSVTGPDPDGAGPLSSPQTTYSYNDQGQVTVEVDPLGQRTTSTYLDDGRLHTVTQPDPDGVGGLASAVTTYSYDDTAHTTTITDPRGHLTTLAYDARGRLVSQTNALGGVTSYTYDAAGNQLTVTDALNHTTTYGYDAAGRQVSVTDAAGTVTTVYDSQGRVVATVDALSHRTTFAYDAAGRQSGVEDALGHWTTTLYDAAGNVTETLDALSNATQYEYDALNRQTVAIDAAGGRTTTLYDAAGNVTEVLDPRNNATQYEYDALNRQTVTINAAGGRTTTLYDGGGNVTEVLDPRNNATQYKYDALNRVTVTIDAAGGRTTTLYDVAGNVTEVFDPRNNATQYEYDALNRVTVTIDAASGRTTTLFDAAGNVTETIDPRNNATQYDYDAAGRQTVIIDAASGRTTTLFDAAGNVTEVIDARNNATQYEYDALNRASVTIDAASGRTTTLYDAAGNVTEVFDTRNNTTQYEYDALNRMTVTIDAASGRTTTLYDAAGNVTGVYDTGNHLTQYEYDALNRVSVTIDPLSGRTTMLFDAAGNVTSASDRNGNTTQYEYDALNRVTVAVDAASGRTTTLYDAAGNVTSVTNPRGFTTQYEYDALNRLTVTVDAASGRTTMLYDAAGNMTSVTDARSDQTQYEYDALNRQTVTVNALSQRTTTLYDAAGNVTSVTSVSGDQTQYEYDALNRQTVTIDALTNRTTTLYDAAGNVTSVTDAENGFNNTTTFQYDALNRKTLATSPQGYPTQYAYNAAGLLSQSIDPLGQEIDYLYDAGNRLTGQTWYNATPSVVNRVTYTYDANGNLLTAADAHSAYTLSYDALNRVTVAQEPFSQTLTFAYDAAGNRIGVQDSQGGVQTSLYDALNRLTSQQFSGVSTTQLREDLTYNAVGEVLTLTRYSDLTASTKIGSTSYSYDAVNRVTSLQQRNGSGSLLENTTYTYDDTGHKQTQQLNGGSTVTYTFDATGQLLSDGTTTNSYDGTGNRTSGSDSPGADNQLTTDGTWTYSYDHAGNLIEKSQGPSAETWTYGYDDRNRLVVAKDWSAAPDHGGSVLEEVDYTYDVLGNRIEESVSLVGPDTTTVTKFAYDGWKTQGGSIQATVGTENFDVWADLTSGNALQTRYLRGDAIDQVFARVASDGTAAWYLTDRLGSVVNLTDASGALQDTITYDGWGNFTESSPSYGDRYKWTGREYDTATGLQYNRARWYDPAAGRWMSQDPLGFGAGDSNLYRYVNNDSGNGLDPSGQKILIQLTDLPSGVKGHGRIWVINKDCTEAHTYDGTGPGRLAGLTQILLGPFKAFYDDYRPQKDMEKNPDAKKMLADTDPKSIIVISDGDYTTEKLALDVTFKSTWQIPLYNSLELNSNTWGMAMLNNAKQYISLDLSNVKLTGGTNNRGWGYGGEYFDKTGNATKKLLELVKQWSEFPASALQPEKEQLKVAAANLKAILDKRAKEGSTPLPTVEEFQKMLKDLGNK